MLKKGQLIKFTKPVSTMRTVFEAVEQGSETRLEIAALTNLAHGQIRSALFNLTFIGAIKRYQDEQGRSRYTIPGRMVGPVAPCLKGVRSIFDVL
jgi:hypothetical protein